jgi:hypothetical protein
VRFAEAADLGEWLGQTFSAAQSVRADKLLDAATGLIQDYTEQTISQVEGEVITLDGEGRRRLLLPQIPVTAVASVDETVDGTTTTLVEDDDYTWTESGILARVDGSWPSEPRSVEVTYSHGFGTVPQSIVGICLAAAARVFSNPSSVRSQAIDGYSVQFFGQGQSGVWLVETELSVLDRYKP